MVGIVFKEVVCRNGLWLRDYRLGWLFLCVGLGGLIVSCWPTAGVLCWSSCHRYIAAAGGAV